MQVIRAQDLIVWPAPQAPLNPGREREHVHNAQMANILLRQLLLLTCARNVLQDRTRLRTCQIAFLALNTHPPRLPARIHKHAGVILDIRASTEVYVLPAWQENTSRPRAELFSQIVSLACLESTRGALEQDRSRAA